MEIKAKKYKVYNKTLVIFLSVNICIALEGHERSMPTDSEKTLLTTIFGQAFLVQ